MAGSVSDTFAGRPVISRGFFLLIHGVEIDWLQQQRWESAVGNEAIYVLTYEREQCIRAGCFECPLLLLIVQTRDGEHPCLLNFYQEGGLTTGCCCYRHFENNLKNTALLIQYLMRNPKLDVDLGVVIRFREYLWTPR